MPKSRVARRILSAASLLVVLALALAAPSPGNGPRSDGRTPAVEASAGRPPAAEADAGLEAGHGPAPGGAGVGTAGGPGTGAAGGPKVADGPQVAANAGDPLAQAFVAIDASGGFTLQETVTQSLAGSAPSEAQIALVYDARGEGGASVLAWGLAAVSDSPVPEPVRLFAEDGTLYYDSGDGWQPAPYGDLSDVFAALGLYDDWGWFADAYRAGKVRPVLADESGRAAPPAPGLAAPGAEGASRVPGRTVPGAEGAPAPSPSGSAAEGSGAVTESSSVPGAPAQAPRASEVDTYTLEIDRAWLADLLAAEGLGVVPVQAVYRLTVGRAENGPEIRAEGRLRFALGKDELTVGSQVVVRSVLGLPPVEPPPDLPRALGGGSTP